jgi:hypothetical protein
MVLNIVHVLLLHFLLSMVKDFPVGHALISWRNLKAIHLLDHHHPELSGLLPFVPPSVSLLQEAKVEDLMLPLLPMEKDFLVKVLW